MTKSALRVCLCLAALGAAPGPGPATGFAAHLPAPLPELDAPPSNRLSDYVEVAPAERVVELPAPVPHAAEPVSDTARLLPAVATPTAPATPTVRPNAAADDAVPHTATPPPPTASPTRPPAPPTATPRPALPSPVLTAPSPADPGGLASGSGGSALLPIVPSPVLGQPQPVPGLLPGPLRASPAASPAVAQAIVPEAAGRPAAPGNGVGGAARSLRDNEPDLTELVATSTPLPMRTPTPPAATPTLRLPTPTATPRVTATATLTPTATAAVTRAPQAPEIEDVSTWEETVSLVSIAPSALTLPPTSDGPTFVLSVPYRSQLDGTAYARANCGPASLAMVLEAYGIRVPTSRLRHQSNQLQGTYGYDDGIALDYLAQIAEREGLEAIGLYGRGGGNVFYNYKRWTVEEIREHVLAGHPVITLARYQALPGNSWSAYSGDHYIVITGLFGRNFVYNDAAFVGSMGYARLMSEQTLLKVWQTSSIPHHAVAFAPGKTGSSLRTVEINRSESSRAALLAVAQAAEESLRLTEPVASNSAAIGFNPDGQLQVHRRGMDRWAEDESERPYGRFDAMAGLLEANGPTEMRHLGPRPGAAVEPTAATPARPGLSGIEVEPVVPVGAAAAAPAPDPVATAQPGDVAITAEAPAAGAPVFPSMVGNQGPIAALLDGLVHLLREVAQHLPLLRGEAL